MQRTLTENRIFRRLRSLRLWEKLLVQGLILAVVLVAVQMWLANAQQSFMAYMPPIGLALLMFLTYLVQPIAIGVLNIAVINLLYKTKGWQVGFWLNGIFLLLLFSTVNLLMQTTLNLPFTYVAAIDVVVLAFPFGCIARFSNGGWKKPLD